MPELTPKQWLERSQNVTAEPEPEDYSESLKMAAQDVVAMFNDPEPGSGAEAYAEAKSRALEKGMTRLSPRAMRRLPPPDENSLPRGFQVFSVPYRHRCDETGEPLYPEIQRETEYVDVRPRREVEAEERRRQAEAKHKRRPDGGRD